VNYTNIHTPAPSKAKDRARIKQETQAFLLEHEITQIKQGATGIPEKPKKGMQIHIKSKR